MHALAIRFAVLGLATLGLAGCETGPEIRADYDKSVDFGKYHTYNFVAVQSSGSDYKSLGQRIMQNAATREMESRGYTKADNADLLINFRGKIEEKTDVESTPAVGDDGTILLDGRPAGGPRGRGTEPQGPAPAAVEAGRAGPGPRLGRR